MTLVPSWSRMRRSSGTLVTWMDQEQTPIARGWTDIDFTSMRDGAVVPHGWEELPLQNFTRLDGNPRLHQVCARRLVPGVAGHVVDGDGGATAVGAVGRAAVPGEAV